MRLRVVCDARGVLDRLLPFAEQALQDGLLTETELADLLLNEILETIQFVEKT